MKKIFVITGESSGDNLAADIFSKLKQSYPGVRIIAIGGERMSTIADEIFFSINEINVMGFVEIIPHIPRLIRLINKTINKIISEKPDLVVSIDAPDFSFRVVKKLQQLRPQTKFVHIVAPTVWAYREYRAKKIAKIYDHLMCLFPFEPDYFIKYGLSTSFIGHPLAWKINNFEQQQEKIYLPIFPGSRKKEIDALLEIFVNSAQKLCAKSEYLKPVILVNNNICEYVKSKLKNVNIKIVTNEIERKEILSKSNIALVKSGTMSLEIACYNIPQIVAYKVNFVSGIIAKMLLKVKYVSLVNIIANKQVVPEYLQENCTENFLLQALEQLYLNESAKLEQQLNYKIIKDQLAKNDPSDKAVDILLKLM